MFQLIRPDNAAIEQFLHHCKEAAFSFEEVGGSKMQAPPGYVLDHNRTQVGHGPEDYEKAKKAIDQWKMFDFQWVKLFRTDTPIVPGNDVAIVARHLGFYSINGSRIVYVVNESGTVNRYGFAYGTLTCHAESGEERFLVEFDSKTGEVWYDLLAFSKPNHPLARIGYLYSRYLQKEFAKASMDAMKRAVKITY